MGKTSISLTSICSRPEEQILLETIFTHEEQERDQQQFAHISEGAVMFNLPDSLLQLDDMLDGWGEKWMFSMTLAKCSTFPA